MAKPKSGARQAAQPEGLTIGDVDVLRGVGRRLAAELGATIAELSPVELSIRQMATNLKVDATVCQRVIGASKLAAAPLEAIRRAPGAAGLKLFMDACRRRGVSRQVLGRLEAAVQGLERATSEIGGSRLGLGERIEVWMASGSGQTSQAEAGVVAQESIRRDLFKHAVRWLGNRMDARIGITILRPSPVDSKVLQGIALSACVGYRARHGVGPLTAYVFASKPDGEASDDESAAHSAKPHDMNAGPVLIPGLSSESVTLSARQEVRRLMYVVDVEPRDRPKGVDIAFSVNLPEQPNPVGSSLPHYVSSMRVRHPAARCVHDVFLHRSLAAVCVARPGCSAADTRIIGDRAAEAWEEHLPCPHRVEMLGVGVEMCDTSAWGREREAVAHLFAQAGWNPMHFAGFRLDVRYPVWGSSYYLDFDFGSSGEE